MPAAIRSSSRFPEVRRGAVPPRSRSEGRLAGALLLVVANAVVADVVVEHAVFENAVVENSGLVRPAAAEDPARPPQPGQPEVPAADAPAAAPAKPADPLVPTTWLLLDPPDRRVRRPIRPDAVFLRHLLSRGAPAPKEGEVVVGETGQPCRWTVAPADANGGFVPGKAAWAYTALEVPEACVVLADVRGIGALWVNGDPLPAHVYGYGGEGVPVALAAGTNHVFLAGPRGTPSFRLTRVPESLSIGSDDRTLPDAVEGEPLASPAGIVVRNFRRRPAGGLRLSAGGPASDAFDLPPLWLAKRPVSLVAAVPAKDASKDGAKDGGTRAAEIVLSAAGLDLRAPVSVPVRDPGAPRRVTFVSAMDGSAQEYGWLPEDLRRSTDAPRTLVLTLHGASVQAYGQVSCYAPKPGIAVAAPTNRRPFGFDWQDWGRRDAYEVLDDALAKSGIDPVRVHLTGHSMGGHGTWHLAANDPDRWLSIAPSAGWVSFDSYGGARPRTPLSRYWFGGDGGSDTLALLPNLVPLPVYVVHGAKDDNVPLSEAQTMLQALAGAGASPKAHVEPEGGHWWDDPKTPGADCVDLPAVFAHMAGNGPRQVPARWTWRTFDPGLDGEHHGVRVEQFLRYGEAATVEAERDVAAGRLTLRTQNVRWLGVRAPAGETLRSLDVDGTPVAATRPVVWLRRSGDAWMEVGGPPGAEEKSAARTGPLKRAFERNFLLVLPTRGTPEERAEALARARNDAFQWWYRGNGTATVVTDDAFAAGARRTAGRNVILYGNADTNAAWSVALGADAPFDVRRGKVSVGGRTFEGSGIAAFFVAPRAGDLDALVGVLGDTGVAGLRLGHLHALFTSGAGYPDYVVWDTSALTAGDGGVLATGWWDASWRPDGQGFLAPEPTPAPTPAPTPR